jgi:hypothetical protein
MQDIGPQSWAELQHHASCYAIGKAASLYNGVVVAHANPETRTADKARSSARDTALCDYARSAATGAVFFARRGWTEDFSTEKKTASNVAIAIAVGGIFEYFTVATAKLLFLNAPMGKDPVPNLEGNQMVAVGDLYDDPRNVIGRFKIGAPTPIYVDEIMAVVRERLVFLPEPIETNLARALRDFYEFPTKALPMIEPPRPAEPSRGIKRIGRLLLGHTPSSSG